MQSALQARMAEQRRSQLAHILEKDEFAADELMRAVDDYLPFALGLYRARLPISVFPELDLRFRWNPFLDRGQPTCELSFENDAFCIQLLKAMAYRQLACEAAHALLEKNESSHATAKSNEASSPISPLPMDRNESDDEDDTASTMGSTPSSPVVSRVLGEELAPSVQVLDQLAPLRALFAVDSSQLQSAAPRLSFSAPCPPTIRAPKPLSPPRPLTMPSHVETSPTTSRVIHPDAMKSLPISAHRLCEAAGVLIQLQETCSQEWIDSGQELVLTVASSPIVLRGLVNMLLAEAQMCVIEHAQQLRSDSMCLAHLLMYASKGFRVASQCFDEAEKTQNVKIHKKIVVYVESSFMLLSMLAFKMCAVDERSKGNLDTALAYILQATTFAKPLKTLIKVYRAHFDASGISRIESELGKFKEFKTKMFSEKEKKVAKKEIAKTRVLWPSGVGVCHPIHYTAPVPHMTSLDIGTKHARKCVLS